MHMPHESIRFSSALPQLLAARCQGLCRQGLQAISVQEQAH